MTNLFIHAYNEEIRQKASSGGFCKAFLCYLIDNQVVDYVILTRVKENSSEPETIITKDKNKILTRTNSIYQYNNQIKILENIDPNKKYCFIGLPCFVKYIKNQQKIKKLENIVLTISILCNQAPNENFKLQILQDHKIDQQAVTNIDYRYGEHPGRINIEMGLHKAQTYDHEYAWSRYNTKYCFTPECCRHCDLYESTYSDITVGDAWHTKYGRDKKGWTKVTVNTQKVLNLIDDAATKKYINIQKADPKIEIENRVVGKVNKKNKQKSNVLLHTFHYANNYGAILQAYALQEILKYYGRNVSFLNFYNKNNKNCIEQNSAMKQFHQKYIQSTRHYDSFTELKNSPPDNIDVYLSGSDQIFNTEGGFFNHTFLQKYHNKTNKIAYAASFGIDYVHKNIEKEFLELLSKFKNISVREYEGMELLHKYGIKSTLCLDPTLIVPKNFWNDFSLLSNLSIKQKYNLLYSPYGGCRSEEFSRASSNLNNEYDCILLDMKTDYCPIDFVYLFANAENIITDSYHGLIFSHLFNKNMILVKNSLKTRNSRFNTLNRILSDNSIYTKAKNDSIKFLIDNTQRVQ